MPDKRLLELALKGLAAERERVEQEIVEIIKALGAATRKIAGQPTGRRKTAAERRALSLRMKEIWAKRKARASKAQSRRARSKAATVNSAPVKAKKRVVSAAAKKAASSRMKAYWAKKKAEAAKKAPEGPGKERSERK